MGASISESSGIPKRKKFFRGVSTSLAPQFTGEVFLTLYGLRFRDSGRLTEILRPCHVRGPVVAAQKRGHGAHRFRESPTFMTESTPPLRPRIAPAGLLFLGPKYPRSWGLPEEACGDE